MLETIRQYASEKLVQQKEDQAQHDRHLEYFLHLAEQAAPHLLRDEQLDWLERLDLDRENLRSALEWPFSWNRPSQPCACVPRCGGSG